MDKKNIPVIVAGSEVVQRWRGAEHALHPLALAATAACRLDHRDLLSEVDSLDFVNLVSWRYPSPAKQLADVLSISPKRSNYGQIGGETPVRLMDGAAMRIRSGESNICLICGAEAQYSVAKAKSENERLPWPERPAYVHDDSFWDDYLSPRALVAGVTEPTQVYPLFETACQAAWGQSPSQAQAESARMWAAMSEVATRRDASWSRIAFTEEEIAAVTPTNRMITWPYTKRMVANPKVDQASAILIASWASANAAGFSDDELIFLGSGACATEPRDYLARQSFSECPSQAAVLSAAESSVGGQSFDLVELYSCFPVVPKLAQRTLRQSGSFPFTCTGGLSFFGGPLNNYMSHAAIAMFETMRGSNANLGLLYGQGEFMTKHHSLVLARSPNEVVSIGTGETTSTPIAKSSGSAPTLTQDYIGEAVVETSTVIFDRNGEVARGAVIARTPSGERALLNVPKTDHDTLDVLMDCRHNPVGLRGKAYLQEDHNRFAI